MLCKTAEIQKPTNNVGSYTDRSPCERRLSDGDHKRILFTVILPVVNKRGAYDPIERVRVDTPHHILSPSDL